MPSFCRSGLRKNIARWSSQIQMGLAGRLRFRGKHCRVLKNVFLTGGRLDEDSERVCYQAQPEL